MISYVSLASPLEQFELTMLFPCIFYGFNISITNVTLFLICISTLLILFFKLSLYKANILPSNWLLSTEFHYDVISTLIKENLGYSKAVYFPFIFSIYIFLLFCNLVGMIPYSFTLTSHIAFTFGLSLFIFIGINIIGVQTHGFKFFALFLPRGVPLIIIPLLVTIEFLSYIVKVFTLSIRLFANMTSGHTLLKIIAGFAWTMLSAGGILTLLYVIPLSLLFILIGLEFAIAGLQAYVFTLLTCIYLKDVLDFH
uniref:ATP synthase subunit a n=1 Tax=Pterocladiophila hemisphaerica TaxID=2712948 RepID=A0A6M3WWY3_9FLOR|nr:Atp6 [Pterocladiophila hemisphaerica]